ncbi:glycosyltransferase [Luteirhabdus pelagi]|uniref:glycosyltransferase n=1 Tax=Luteirhabdus pelagi TaxID=2792783 RepID=UPI001939B2DF|nr:glycosyltransferase [Luteirhabdus pelagi]
MKVLHINTSPRGGAGIAAMRLQQALLEKEVAAAFISNTKTIDFAGEVMADPFFNYKKAGLGKKIKQKLMPSADRQVKDKLKALADTLQYETVSTAYAPYTIEKHPLVAQADILHLHWVGGFVDYPSFFKKIKKPIVWTLHDMNPFKGLFHYEEDEKRNEKWVGAVDRQQATLKRKAIQQISKGALVTPSKWMMDKAVKSTVFDHFQEKEVIPNGIDLNLFLPQPTESFRTTHGISPTETVLLYVAGGKTNNRKGAILLQNALAKITTPITLIIVGEVDVQLRNTAVKTIPLGFVKNQASLAVCYAAADAVVLPSREDNLPNVMLEALSCGTPVISFPNGGMKEHIEEGKTGYVATEVSDEALYIAILKFMDTKAVFDEDAIRAYAEEHFSFDQQASSYQKLYKRILI